MTAAPRAHRECSGHRPGGQEPGPGGPLTPPPGPVLFTMLTRLGPPRRRWGRTRARCALLAAAGATLAAGCAAPRPAPDTTARRPPLTSWFNASAPASVEVERPLLVRPRINNTVVGWFFVDTGATGMVINPESAAHAGLAQAGQTRVVGARRFEATNWRAGSFELGPLHLSNVDLAGVDVSFISPGPETPVVGIVGADMFRAAVVEIDMTVGSVRLFDPASYTLPRGRWEAVKEVTGGIAVECRFEGDHAGLFLIDTGGDFGVAFDLADPVAAEVLDGRRTRRQVLRGVGGVEWGRAGTLEWLQIGDHRLGPVGARFFSPGRFDGAGSGVMGLIGSQVLREFVLIIDWGKSRVAFLRRD